MNGQQKFMLIATSWSRYAINLTRKKLYIETWNFTESSGILLNIAVTKNITNSLQMLRLIAMSWSRYAINLTRKNYIMKREAVHDDIIKWDIVFKIA